MHGARILQHEQIFAQETARVTFAWGQQKIRKHNGIRNFFRNTSRFLNNALLPWIA